MKLVTDMQFQSGWVREDVKEFVVAKNKYFPGSFGLFVKADSGWVMVMEWRVDR